MTEVHRLLRWFQKDPGDGFVGEADLVGINLMELQRVFGVSENDPMYEVYPVSPEHVGVIQPHVEVTIDLNRYDYFVEADAVSS